MTIIKQRIFFYDALLDHDIRKIWILIKSEHIGFRDILSFCFFPLTIVLKYNDNS